MRTVSIRTTVHREPAEIYRLLADFRAYPRHMPSVRKVDVAEGDGRQCVSSWEVDFRDGILKWTERDVFSPEKLRIEFSQIEGDLDVFSGYWQVASNDDGDGGSVVFCARFDLGIPSLAAFLEPVAQKALEENVEKILNGLFGEGHRITAEAEASS